LDSDSIVTCAILLELTNIKMEKNLKKSAKIIVGKKTVTKKAVKKVAKKKAAIAGKKAVKKSLKKNIKKNGFSEKIVV
jgi:hypothetical protein